MDEQNHREKRTQWWPRLVTSAVSSRKRNINLLICLQCLSLCVFVDIRKPNASSTGASPSLLLMHGRANHPHIFMYETCLHTCVAHVNELHL